MKHNFILFLFLYTFSYSFSQEIILSVSFEKSNSKKLLSNLNYLEKHKDTISLYKEVHLISNTLKKRGYFTNTFKVSRINKKKYTAFFTLNKKINSAVLRIDASLKKYLQVKKDSLINPIENLESKLSEISKKLDEDGQSFSKIQLKNILIENQKMFAFLEVKQSKKREINKVLIKGYDNFPKSFLKNYFNLNKQTLFNKKKLLEISSATNNLQFVKEVKKPEVLFTKDSTLVYLYLKKNQNSSFDGIVNFASKENGDLLFNGNINLKLNNTLNKGEKFELFWNSIEQESQEFKLAVENPYIFNTKISPHISFSIYKQDSTFLNTSFNSKLFYNLTNKTKLALTYSSESSENLNQELTNNIETFNNYFVGFQLKYSIPNYDFFFNDKLLIEINPSFGQRRNDSSNLTQFKIKSTIAYLWNISLKSSVYIKNTLGFLNSDSFIDNELFRIGGANSLRGFNEQSIFSNNFTYFNIEYRLLTSNKSYLYTITDIANVETIFNKDIFTGLGLGYKFRSKNSDINIGLVSGANSTSNFSTENTKLILRWVNYF